MATRTSLLAFSLAPATSSAAAVCICLTCQAHIGRQGFHTLQTLQRTGLLLSQLAAVAISEKCFGQLFIIINLISKNLRCCKLNWTQLHLMVRKRAAEVGLSQPLSKKVCVGGFAGRSMLSHTQAVPTCRFVVWSCLICQMGHWFRC